MEEWRVSIPKDELWGIGDPAAEPAAAAGPPMPPPPSVRRARPRIICLALTSRLPLDAADAGVCGVVCGDCGTAGSGASRDEARGGHTKRPSDDE